MTFSKVLKPCRVSGKTQPVLANPFPTVDDSTFELNGLTSLDEHHIPAGIGRRIEWTDQLDVVVTVNGQVLLIRSTRRGGHLVTR